MKKERACRGKLPRAKLSYIFHYNISIANITKRVIPYYMNSCSNGYDALKAQEPFRLLYLPLDSYQIEQHSIVEVVVRTDKVVSSTSFSQDCPSSFPRHQQKRNCMHTLFLQLFQNQLQRIGLILNCQKIFSC